MAEAVPYPLAFHSNIPRLTGGHIGDAGFPGALLGGHDGRVEQAFFATFEHQGRLRLRYGPLVSSAGSSSGQVSNERDRLLRALCSVIAVTASFSLAQRAMLCRSANTSH